MKLRALFAIRDNFDSVTGGDGVQMLKTRSALESLGVEVTLKKFSEIDPGSLSHYDVGHLFNIQTFDASWEAMQLLKTANVPVALSTIYWDTFDHMADMAGRDHPVWSKVRKVMGRSRFRTLYIDRMRAKHYAGAEFQTQKRLLESADILLPNSPSEGALLNDLFGCDYSAKTNPIVNAIDTDLYPPQRASDYFKKTLGIENPILQVGRISPLKNQRGVIEALRDTKIPLVFIGQTEHEGYAADCRRLGEARGGTYFIERIAHEELPGIYASARVHVLPSWRETPGLASLEAAAAGCRIVTTTIGSTRDYFGDDARYVFPDDAAGIRAALLAAYEEPRDGSLAERIAANYNWKRAAEQTLDAYRTIAGR